MHMLNFKHTFKIKHIHRSLEDQGLQMRIPKSLILNILCTIKTKNMVGAGHTFIYGHFGTLLDRKGKRKVDYVTESCVENAGSNYPLVANNLYIHGGL